MVGTQASSYTEQEKAGFEVSTSEDKDQYNGMPPVSQVLTTEDLKYDLDDQPVFHHRTYLALAALFILNWVQIVALNGPPGILHYIGHDLHGSTVQTWIPNALSLVQAVGSPVISFASDTFQARKQLLVVTCTISFIGAAIAPGATNIYRVIVAQILIGVGFAAVPLAYAIPSEIVPRKWRPIVLALMNVAAQGGALSGSLAGGALTRISEHKGWRNLYWIQMALWGFCVVGIIIGYRPPKRHTRLDHLSFWQKVATLDLPGMALLSSGLSLLLAGLTLGDNPWEWSDVRVLTTLIIGFVLLICFGLYEWKGTKTGILHHELFSLRTFPLSVGLMFIEGIMLFSVVVFYPALNAALFTSDPFVAVARAAPYWVTAALGTLVFGVWSSKRRTIRSPMLVGFVIFVAGLVGMATVQSHQSLNAIVFDALAGFGYGSPLILIVVGVQLATPHHLIATATAVLTSTRAVAASTFTAIYSAVVASSSKSKLPAYAASAAAKAGISADNVPAFVKAATAKNATALAEVPGVTAEIVTAGLDAVKQAQMDSYRLVYIIAASVGVLGCVLTYFVDDMTTLMSYRVDAPVEELHGKHENTTA